MKFELDEKRVIREIAPDDEMYEGDLDLYLDIGRSALESIAPALETSPRKRFLRILDLPCGHGRVLRMLRAAFPKSEITACDISREGVDFCARTFDAIPVYSTEDPRELELPGEFDLIWCGSLLTHVDEDRWAGFLDLFESVLSPGGVLVFTTHGRRVAFMLDRVAQDLGLGEQRTNRLLEDFGRSGFAYQDYPGQTRYGISLSAPGWVAERVTAKSSWRMVEYREGGWKGYQDVVACLRTPIEWLPPRLRHLVRPPASP